MWSYVGTVLEIVGIPYYTGDVADRWWTCEYIKTILRLRMVSNTLENRAASSSHQFRRCAVHSPTNEHQCPQHLSGNVCFTLFPYYTSKLNRNPYLSKSLETVRNTTYWYDNTRLLIYFLIPRKKNNLSVHTFRFRGKGNKPNFSKPAVIERGSYYQVRLRTTRWLGFWIMGLWFWALCL